MNQVNEHTWSTATTEQKEDFTSFLNFSDADLDFSYGESIIGSADEQRDAMELNENFARQTSSTQIHSPQSLPFITSDTSDMSTLKRSLFTQSPPAQAQNNHVQSDNCSPNLQRQQQMPDSRYYQHGMVPPTPDSVEMHGQAPSYGDHQAVGMYESSKYQDQMVFTPLVSPAFQLQEFAHNSEYFSPLTSPALHAQDYTNSTVVLGDQDSDHRGKDSPASTIKKPRRRNNNSSKDPVRTIRSSPAMKAQQKRYSTGNKSSRDISEVIPEPQTLQQVSPRLVSSSRTTVLRSEANSEAGSISPEPLSDVLMPPPAAPRSSSYGQKAPSNQNDLFSTVIENNLPATPASLFRIQKPSILTALRSDISMSQSIPLETDATEPVSTSNIPSSLDSNDIAASDISRAPQATTVSIPSTSMSATQIHENRSPTHSQMHHSSKELSVSSRARKKRGSSSHVSPALRPRISPVIKPLLSGVANYDSETTAALLANKSNYERIIDGSASQLGVNYSAQLSENLTSKRTSHKIAEQGRRNRINTALAEIQTLLPDDLSRENVDNLTGSIGGASKAKTVESAIEFIKFLKRELADTKSELTRVKAQVEKYETQDDQT